MPHLLGESGSPLWPPPAASWADAAAPAAPSSPSWRWNSRWSSPASPSAAPSAGSAAKSAAAPSPARPGGGWRGHTNADWEELGHQWNVMSSGRLEYCVSRSVMWEISRTAAGLGLFYLQPLQLWTSPDVLLQFTVNCSRLLLDASSFHWKGEMFKTLTEAGRMINFASTLTFDSALVLTQFLCSLHKLLLQVQLIPVHINTAVKPKVLMVRQSGETVKKKQ